MPSSAYKIFQANLEYVASIQSGPLEDVPKKERDGKFAVISDENKDIKLNHTNRAALMVLYGSWEQYIKDVVRDSGNVFIEFISKWLNRHKQGQDRTDGSGENPKHSQGMPESTIATWKNSYEEYIRGSIERFGSPKCSNIDIFLKRTVGVTCEMFSPPDSDGRSLNEFINTRNKIAHQGVEGNDIITSTEVLKYRRAVHRLAANTDNYLLSELRNMHPRKTPPWDGQAKIDSDTG